MAQAGALLQVLARTACPTGLCLHHTRRMARHQLAWGAACLGRPCRGCPLRWEASYFSSSSAPWAPHPGALHEVEWQSGRAQAGPKQGQARGQAQPQQGPPQPWRAMGHPHQAWVQRALLGCPLPQAFGPRDLSHPPPPPGLHLRLRKQQMVGWVLAAAGAAGIFQRTAGHMGVCQLR